MSTVLPVKTPDFLDALHSRVLIGDGAMGTQLQGFDLDVETDFLGLEGCNEILNDTRPDVVAQIHRAYFTAGADLVETNTFGCNLPNLTKAPASPAPSPTSSAPAGTGCAASCSAPWGPARNCPPSGTPPTWI